jgi:hypothetical protein
MGRSGCRLLGGPFEFRGRMHVRRVMAAGCGLLLAISLISGCATAASPTAAPRPLEHGATPTESSAVTTASVDYTGFWCDTANARSRVASTDGIDELEVSASSAQSLKFTLSHTGPAPARRITSSVTTVTARVTDGVAQFDFTDDRGGVHRGKVELDGNRLLVQLEASADADAPMLVDCVMVRDPYHSSRQVDDSAAPIDFIGAPGTYSPASEPSDIPSIKVGAVVAGIVPVSITGTFNRRVYFAKISGRVVAAKDVELKLPGTNCRLRLRWSNPGTLTASRVSGTLPSQIRELTRSATYWNSSYLHTN